MTKSVLRFWLSIVLLIIIQASMGCESGAGAWGKPVSDHGNSGNPTSIIIQSYSHKAFPIPLSESLDITWTIRIKNTLNARLSMLYVEYRMLDENGALLEFGNSHSNLGPNEALTISKKNIHIEPRLFAQVKKIGIVIHCPEESGHGKIVIEKILPVIPEP